MRTKPSETTVHMNVMRASYDSLPKLEHGGGWELREGGQGGEVRAHPLFLHLVPNAAKQQ